MIFFSLFYLACEFLLQLSTYTRGSASAKLGLQGISYKTKLTREIDDASTASIAWTMGAGRRRRKKHRVFYD